jgi:Zn-dependent peptidase ImmA (M78 family)
MDVKKIATKLAAKYKTNDPFTIADLRGINVLDCPMKSTFGYYTKYRRVQNIILNSNMPEELRRFVCAHELGHAICHTDLNTQWLKENTLFSVDKVERQASSFAVELLLPDNIVSENIDLSLYDLSKLVGIPMKLTVLKKHFIVFERKISFSTL